MAERNILTVDIGNSAVKCTRFEGGRECGVNVLRDSDAGALRDMIESSGCEGVSFCSVRLESATADMLRVLEGMRVVELDADTPVPVEVDYDSRASLGADRLAAAVGVAEPGRNVIVVDAGTAVTCDLVAGCRFAGGNISPGLRLRFKALGEYASRLPEVERDGELPLFGHDTRTAIRAGVVRGLCAEIAGSFADASRSLEDIKMVITGGDADFLYPLLRDRIPGLRVDHSVVARGLLKIFNYNNNDE